MSADPKDPLFLTPERIAELDAEALKEPLLPLSDEEAEEIFGGGMVISIGPSLLQLMIEQKKREWAERQRREQDAQEG